MRRGRCVERDKGERNGGRRNGGCETWGDVKVKTSYTAEYGTEGWVVRTIEGGLERDGDGWRGTVELGREQ